MFSSIKEAWNNDPVKEMTRRINTNNIPERSQRESIYKFTDNPTYSDGGISLMSEDLVNITANDKLKNNNLSIDFSEFADTSIITPQNKCAMSKNHLSQCTDCSNKLNKIIDKKIKQKMNLLLLELNLKQNESRFDLMKYSNTSLNNKIALPESWKETLILMISILIVIYLICLITKSIRS